LPTYDYCCTNEECKHSFDEFFHLVSQRLRPEKKPCPKCGKKTIKLAILSPAYVGDMVHLGRKKPPRGFRDVLNKIEQNVPQSKKLDRW
jgi:putative FmdB family regulatory protein